VQEHPVQTEFPQLGIALAIPVLVIARDWKSGVRGMHPYLVGLACAEIDLHQGRQPAEELNRPERTHRHLTVAAYRDVALATAPFVCGEREFDALVAELPVAAHQRQVPLLDPSFAKLRMQIAQRAAALRDQETTAGLAIEPMHEIELAELGPCGAQRLDHTVRQAAAAVHGESGRLIDRHQICILVDDGVPDRLLQIVTRS